jgi:hypothetical protein
LGWISRVHDELIDAAMPPTSIPIEEWTGSAGDAHSNYKLLSSG